MEKLQDALTSILKELKNSYGKSLSKLHITGELPISVKKLLGQFFNLFDESCRLFISRHHHPDDKVKCHMGCFWCCYQMPYGISTVEYLYLYNGLFEVSPRRLFLPSLLDRSEIIDSISKNVQYLSGKSIIEELLTAYSRKIAPCPFLDKDSKLCLVYSFRPLACRMHVSFSSPRFCHPLHKESWRCEAVNIEPSDMVKEALKELDETFPFSLSQFLSVGIVQFMVNIMRFQPIKWWS
ncbi:MAG: YkgJ family cysteine cluster protein [Thermodesulforhabdaceae bacterium]